MSPDPRDRRRSRSSRETSRAGEVVDKAIRKTGRHPDAQYTVVRLTDPAVEDLVRLNRADPQVLRWALKKMLLLESDPEAGEPLLGDLIGWRKLTVSDRDWRIVWRSTYDAGGAVVVDVAEVWAAGARSDAEVYAEMSARVASLPDSPSTTALADAIKRFAVAGLAAREEPGAKKALPVWLRSGLEKKVGLSADAVAELSLEEAVETWNAWIARPR